MRILIDRDPLITPEQYSFENPNWTARWISPARRPNYFSPALAAVKGVSDSSAPADAPVLDTSPAGSDQRGGVGAHDVPVVIGFTCDFSLDAPAAIRIHVSADQKYELFLDGVRIGRGSESGLLNHWSYESYELPLTAGRHRIAARVIWLGRGKSAPYAWETVEPAFVLQAEGPHADRLRTGVARWRAKVLGGYAFSLQPLPHAFLAVGAHFILDGQSLEDDFLAPGSIDRPASADWLDAIVTADASVKAQHNEVNSPTRLLVPATLPAMFQQRVRVGVVRAIDEVGVDQSQTIAVRHDTARAAEAREFETLLAGEGVVQIAAGSTRRLIIDLQNYFCAYLRVVLSRGAAATVRIHWAETLFDEPSARQKGNRDVVEGKFFHGMGDTIRPAGRASQVFEIPTWRAGRYIELIITTGNQPLWIDSFELVETHYPYEFKHHFESSDSRLASVIPIALRSLEMCSHDAFFDCPYYERLMYVGDTRLQALVTHVTTTDARLPRRAVRLFDESRRPDGLTMSRIPTRSSQVIPPFSLWWVSMLHDYALWKDDADFVRCRLAGMRAVLDAFIPRIAADGLLELGPAWNFVDWVPAWKQGIPPMSQRRVSCVISWQLVLALRQAAELETHCGDADLARRFTRIAGDLADHTWSAFFLPGRGLLADDLNHAHFSEHAQCIALLAGGVPDAHRARLVDRLMHEPQIIRTTTFYTHYLFEALRLVGRMDGFVPRLAPWFELRAKGFRTTFEQPEPSRSDCHAWGAHPVYHYFASVLGIRPAAPGFGIVEIMPRLGGLAWAAGSMPHPRGRITLRVADDSGRLRGHIQLPPGLAGVWIDNHRRQDLPAGFDGEV